MTAGESSGMLEGMSIPEERGQARLAAADIELDKIRTQVASGQVSQVVYERRERELYAAIMKMNNRDR